MRILVNPEEFKSFDVVPAAIYRAIVSGHKTKRIKDDVLSISVEFTIQSQGPDESIKTVGRKIFTNWNINEKGLSFLNMDFKTLTGADLPMGEFEDTQLAEIIMNQTLNKECLLEVTVDPHYKDATKSQNNIKRIQAIP